MALLIKMKIQEKNGNNVYVQGKPEEKELDTKKWTEGRGSLKSRSSRTLQKVISENQTLLQWRF